MSQWPLLPAGGTVQGAEIYGLWKLFCWCGAGVALLVYGLILWCLWRYRDAAGRGFAGAPRFNRNNPLEIGWTLLPLALVAVLFAFTFAVEDRVDAVTRSPGPDVRVTAFRWSWRFSYPKYGIDVVGAPKEPPQLVIPAGETTHVSLTSADVYHEFYVPAFLFKRDAIPGVVTRFDLSTLAPGVYQGNCAEFCGLYHTFMDFTVKVVSPAQFAAWLHANRGKESVAWRR
jgi:cytochrome c oxidase subunit 2